MFDTIRNSLVERDRSSWLSPTCDLLRSNDQQFMNRFYTAYLQCVNRGEFDHLELFVDPDRASIDVGANMGQYSLRLSAISTACLSVEPVPEYACLKGILPSNCHFVNIAAGEVNGQGVLRTPIDANTAHWGLSTLDNDSNFGDMRIIEHTVTTRRLDDIVSDVFPTERIGFIKIDVEGFECAVLSGSHATISQHRPNVQIEVGEENMPSVFRFFDKLGYRGIFLFNHRIHDISMFAPEIHQSLMNRWTPETHSRFDTNVYVCNFYFVPYSS